MLSFCHARWPAGWTDYIDLHLIHVDQRKKKKKEQITLNTNKQAITHIEGFAICSIHLFEQALTVPWADWTLQHGVKVCHTQLQHLLVLIEMKFF